jgi:hypothetical protein
VDDQHGRDGPIVPDTWVTSRRAVLAFDAFCTARKWVFTETPEQSDFGKDGYLDFSHEGRLTGQCVAVQVKGGSSLRRANGYSIAADQRRRRLWMDSTIAVFGIVWDPDEAALYWIDLTHALRAEGIDAPLHIPAANRLDDGDLSDFVEAMWRSTTGTSIAAGLGSDDADLQDAAVFDCWGLGRRDPRYLVLLRRVMFALQPAALDRAIYVLNSCSLNMDNLLDARWMSMADRELVRATFRWTVDEAVVLLDRVQDEDGFGRGSFSSCIYWLLVGPNPRGDHFIELAEAAVLRAAAVGRLHAAGCGLVLRVYWAGNDGLDVLMRLVAAAPVLGTTSQARALGENLKEWGHIEL